MRFNEYKSVRMGVCLSIYNAGRTLSQTLDSLQAFDYIVIVDGLRPGDAQYALSPYSVDDSMEILIDFSSRYQGSIYFEQYSSSEENKITKAFSHALDGDWLLIMRGGDVFHGNVETLRVLTQQSVFDFYFMDHATRADTDIMAVAWVARFFRYLPGMSWMSVDGVKEGCAFDNCGNVVNNMGDLSLTISKFYLGMSIHSLSETGHIDSSASDLPRIVNISPGNKMPVLYGGYRFKENDYDETNDCNGVRWILN